MTKIEWTRGDDGTDGKTWNPVTGCTKVSPGCAHCYAETVAERFWDTQYEPVDIVVYNKTICSPVNEKRPRRFTDVQCHAARLDQPLRWRKPRRIFVNSMSDLFHESVPREFILEVYRRMGAAHWHTYQILTKRAERMRELMPWLSDTLKADGRSRVETWRHLWHGVSVEAQRLADERIPLLLETPAAVRFISAEPLLEAIDLTRWLGVKNGYSEKHGSVRVSSGRNGRAGNRSGRDDLATGGTPREPLDGSDERATVQTSNGIKDRSRPTLAWIICGGESGPQARPCDLAWIRSIIEQCKAAGAPIFVKQLGAFPVDEREVGTAKGGSPIPLKLRDRKGGDPAEWPEDLRVREFPNSKEAAWRRLGSA